MKRIALTFDDGPYFNSLGNKNFTQDILDGIEQINQELVANNKRIYVTFFVQGIHTSKSTSSLSAIIKADHEIGNHAWKHDDWTQNGRLYRSDSELVGDVLDTHSAIERAGGTGKLRLFRPPLGHYNDTLWGKIKAKKPNYVLAGWDFHPEASTNGFEVIGQSLSKGGQAVYLLHELKTNTVEKTLNFIKKAIPKVKSGDVSFVKASDLIIGDKRTGLTVKQSK
jgi:peptidoglycan/xylan/chitin deacetylase (PgdA/CDA1 family)